MDAPLNAIGHEEYIHFQENKYLFPLPKEKDGQITKKKRTEKKKYQGVWQLVSRCVLVNGPLGNWELLKEIDSPA